MDEVCTEFEHLITKFSYESKIDSYSYIENNILKKIIRSTKDKINKVLRTNGKRTSAGLSNP